MAADLDADMAAIEPVSVEVRHWPPEGVQPAEGGTDDGRAEAKAAEIAPAAKDADSSSAGEFAEARGPRGPVALLVPTTYMNDSGSSVGPAAGTLHAAPGQVLVVHDDIDLPFGEVRGKRGGGHEIGRAHV